MQLNMNEPVVEQKKTAGYIFGIILRAISDFLIKLFKIIFNFLIDVAEGYGRKTKKDDASKRNRKNK